MSTIDEVIKKRRKPGEQGDDSGEDSLDSVLKDSDKLLAREAKRTAVEKIVELSKLDVAEARKRRELVENARSETDLVVSVDKKAQAAFLKALVDSGTDPNKAAEFIKSLDDATLARIMVMSGNPTGGNSLAPLLLAARQPSTQIGELVDAAQKITTMVSPSKKEGFLEYAEAFGTVADMLENRKGDDGSDSIREEIRAMRLTVEQEREARHQSELNYQKTIADMKEGNLQGQLQDIGHQLEELRKRDFKAEIADAKATLEAVGLKIGAGGEKDIVETVGEVTDKIMKSPAVEELSRAMGDRIRTGGSMARPQKAPPGSQTIYCEVCASSGVRTPLTVTPEMQAGKADLVCPVCGTSYTKQQG